MKEEDVKQINELINGPIVGKTQVSNENLNVNPSTTRNALPTKPPVAPPQKTEKK